MPIKKKEAPIMAVPAAERYAEAGLYWGVAFEKAKMEFAPKRGRAPKPVAEEARFIKTNFPTHRGFFRIGIDDPIKVGDYIVPRYQIPNADRHAYKLDPACSLRTLKKNAYGDYDLYWVYRKSALYEEDDGKRIYTPRVRPIPLP